LISRSVVAVRLRAPTLAKDLDELLVTLAEHDKRLRAAGGAGKVLRERGVQTVDVIEMDLDAMLAGQTIDPHGLDPIVGKALGAILGLKAREKKLGSAVAISLDRVSTPSSLGSLLDDLIDGSADGVAEHKTPGRQVTGPLKGLGADELASISAQAFGKIGQGNKSPEALAEAAQVLSSALVRLKPEARFKLLQQVAQSDADDAATAALGRAMPNTVLMSALAQVVMGGERDSRLAVAIGGLLERMRPIERERQKIIDDLDETARRAGRPLDGLFLQELNESSTKKAFGGLDLPFRQTRDLLVQAARERRTARGQPEIVDKTFATLRPDHTLQRRTRLLTQVLEIEKMVMPATLSAVQEILRLPAQDPGLTDVGGPLILGLWRRAIQDGPSSPASRLLADVMASPTGPDWCIGLLRQLRGQRGADAGTLLAELIKSVVAVHQGESFRRRLQEALHDLDSGVLRMLERRIAELSPGGVATLIARSAKDSAVAPLALASAAMRANDLEVREAALRALALAPGEQVLAFLRRASGLDGDEAAIGALAAQKLSPTDLFTLKKTAIEALGLSHAPEAVPVLVEHLHRIKLIGGGEFDKLRSFAARALVINNTPAARAAIDDGRRSRHAAVRAACGVGP
jgi:hypothetical protein